MTARLPFTELALRRAISAARKEGMRVKGFSVSPDGTITVHESDVPVAGPEPGAHHAASSEYEDFQP